MRAQIPMPSPEEVERAQAMAQAQAQARELAAKREQEKLKATQEEATKITDTPKPQAPREQPKTQPIKVEKKVGRNDPCPCGSGKKYKNCHGKDIVD